MKNFLYHLTLFIARDLLICLGFVNGQFSFSIRHFSFPPVLKLMEFVVKSFSLHKFNVVTGFDNLAAIQYDNSMGMTNG